MTRYYIPIWEYVKRNFWVALAAPTGIFILLSLRHGWRPDTRLDSARRDGASGGHRRLPAGHGTMVTRGRWRGKVRFEIGTLRRLSVQFFDSLFCFLSTSRDIRSWRLGSDFAKAVARRRSAGVRSG